MTRVSPPHARSPAESATITDSAPNHGLTWILYVPLLQTLLSVSLTVTEAGSEAYRWINANAEYMLETPDEAFDWVYMLKESDWELIVATWDSRSEFCREALAYIVCEGPPIQSRNMLLRALDDTNADVAAQAAESLKSQKELFGDDFPKLDNATMKRVLELADSDA